MEKKILVKRIYNYEPTYGPELILETSNLNGTSLRYATVPWIANSEERQHLIFLSEDDIKGGDWYYNVLSNRCWNASKGFVKSRMTNPKSEYKIVASTDPKMNLPKPPVSFISEYITEFNIGNLIKEVKVDYTYDIHKYGITHHARENYRPKVNKNNEISIKVIYEKKDLKDQYITALEGIVNHYDEQVTYDHEEWNEQLVDLKNHANNLKYKLNKE